MAMTGLQILALLPKTNCKECGCNTCLAFAMKLAAKKAELLAADAVAGPVDVIATAEGLATAEREKTLVKRLEEQRQALVDGLQETCEFFRA